MSLGGVLRCECPVNGRLWSSPVTLSRADCSGRLRRNHQPTLQPTSCSSPFLKANSSSAIQEIVRITGNPEDHYLTHKIPLPVPILSHINAINVSPSHFRKIHFNIIAAIAPRSSLSKGFPLKPRIQPSCPLYVLHAPPILFLSDTPNTAQKPFRAQFLCTLFTALYDGS